MLARAVSAPERLRLWLLRQSWFTSVLLPAMPRQLRWLARKVYLAPIDLADRILGRRDPDLPSKSGVFTGATDDFRASGAAFLKVLESAAGLTPSSRVLDVGCGIGRLAIPMAGFLDQDGGYEGFDIVPEGIEWCQQHISSPHDNVHFTLADLYNKEYNPKGSVPPAEYRFPYEDDAFDLVVLFSVFTHMLPDDVDRYVSEIARVLKKDGRVFATYYVINQDSLQLMKTSGRSKLQFKHNLGSHWIHSGNVPELGVAYEEPYIRNLYGKYGLSDPPTIYFGRWCGRVVERPLDSGLIAQDSVVATKL